MRKLLVVVDMQNDFIDGSLGTARELKRRIREKGLLQEEERERSVVIENSLQDDQMIERSYRLLQAPIN